MFHIASIVDVSMFPNIDRMSHVNVTGKSTWSNTMGFRYLRDEFDFSNVYGIMNTSGLLQS